VKRLYLLDGNDHFYKAYYAFSPRLGTKTDSKGRSIVAIHGFTHFLIKFLKETNPSHIAIVFDPPKTSVQTSPLDKQLLIVKDIIKAFGIPIFESKAYGCADIMASIAKTIAAEEIDVTLISSNKALPQIINEKINVVNPRARTSTPQQKPSTKKNQLPLSTAVPVKFNITDCEIKPPDIKQLSNILRDYELTKLLAQLRQPDEMPQRSYEYINTEDKLKELVSILDKANEFAIDTETTGIDPVQASLVGISISYKPAQGAYIPVGHKYPGVLPQLDKATLLKILGPTLENPNIAKIGQNIKYDLTVLKNFGFTINGVTFDTMLASYLLNPAGRQNNLNDMALKYLDHKTIPIEKLIGKRPFKINMSKAKIEETTDYACEDTDITLQLKKCLQPLLVKRKLLDFLEKIEVPLLEVLTDMQLDGIKPDQAKVKTSKRLAKLINPDTGRVHPSFSQTFSTIGALRTSKPNFQKLLEASNTIKEIVIAEDDAALISAAYKQVKPAVISHLSDGQKIVQEESFMQHCVVMASKNGFVKTILGRRRYMPEFKSPDKPIRKLAQQEAIDTIIKGSAADLIKAAMIKIYRSLKQKHLRAKIILQVEDELILEAPNSEIEEVKLLVKNCMEKVVKLKRPLSASISAGKSWVNLKTGEPANE